MVAKRRAALHDPARERRMLRLRNQLETVGDAADDHDGSQG
jgi:hypothetical protein